MEEASKWYVLRVRYNQWKMAIVELQNSFMEVYNPLHDVVKRINGKIVHQREPLLGTFLFVHCPLANLFNFLKQSPLRYQHMRIFRDKTKPKDAFGKNPPLFISDRDMENFQKVTSIFIDESDEGAGVVKKKVRINYKPGDKVKVIRGPFVGIEGRVARIKGQQRVVVELPGICKYATSYIATSFLEPVKD